MLNSIMDVTRVGGPLGIPGLYVTGDPGAVDDAAKQGSLSIQIGLGWAKSHSFTTGQCPVMKYHRGLMEMILHDRAHIAKAVNATVVTLDEAPQGLRGLRQGRREEVRAQPARRHQGLIRDLPAPGSSRGRGGCPGVDGTAILATAQDPPSRKERPYDACRSRP